MNEQDGKGPLNTTQPGQHIFTVWTRAGMQRALMHIQAFGWRIVAYGYEDYGLFTIYAKDPRR